MALKSPVETKSCGNYVLWKLSPWNKKFLEIKSYHLDTLFSRTFFRFQYDFLKWVSGKKSSCSGKCMGTKDVYNHGQRNLKHSWLYSTQSPFYENFLDLTLFSLGTFFFRTLNPTILFPKTFFAAPILF